jgi:prepilin-type N-terminal cleavage/methylation domain-containing protein/prepilin-type processing-associated H-X9-DG protein
MLGRSLELKAVVHRSVIKGVFQRPKAKTHRSAPIGFTLVELLVVIAIIGILVALLLPAIQAAREAARRTQCQTNLHNLALGVLNYNDSFKTFPYAIRVPLDATGKNIYNATSMTIGGTPNLAANWVILILPFMEEQALYNGFQSVLKVNGVDQNLSIGPARDVRSKQLPVMLCPSDLGTSVGPCSLSGGNWARGNYGINFGLSYIIEEDKNHWNRHCGRGVAAINRGAKIAQIEDGTTQTIMLGELRVGLTARDRRGVWAMSMVGSSILAQHASNYAGGPNDCQPGGDDLADEALVEQDVGLDTLKSECMGLGWDHSVQTTVRSRHPGGAHVALCDGSVRFITDNIQCSTGSPHYEESCDGGDQNTDPKLVGDDVGRFGVWQRLNSANDGYVVDQAQY